mgnify:CR=1 FL=1
MSHRECPSFPEVRLTGKPITTKERLWNSVDKCGSVLEPKCVGGSLGKYTFVDNIISGAGGNQNMKGRRVTTAQESRGIFTGGGGRVEYYIDNVTIESVLGQGGPTRMPIVKKFVENAVGKNPESGVDPMEAVAFGAAIQAGIMAGDVESDIVLLDVTPLTLGIETMGGVATPLIEKNTTIPTQKSQIFSTAADNQPMVEIHVVQGERSLAKDNKSLGRFHLDGIPPAPRGTPQIEVSFDMDADGILNVKAVDKATSKEQSIRIEAQSGLSDQEIEKMVNDAKKHEAEDKAKKEEIDTKNQAEQLVFQTEKQMKDLDDKLSDDDKNDLNDALEKLKKANESSVIDDIKSEMENLNSVWSSKASSMYDASNASAQEPPVQESEPGGAEAKDDKKIKDADFEVVED